MTTRGEVLLLVLVAVLALVAGATAQLWDPYTRSVDAVTVQSR